MIFVSRYAERNEMWRTRNAASELDVPTSLFFFLVSAVFASALVWRWAAFAFCLFFSVLFFVISVWSVLSCLWNVRKAWRKDMDERADSLAREVMDS